MNIDNHAVMLTATTPRAHPEGLMSLTKYIISLLKALTSIDLNAALNSATQLNLPSWSTW